MDIRITKTENSKLKYLDFDNIPFGKYTSDHMFVMEYTDGQWKNFRIIPYQGFLLDPQSKALQYSQCIFEGMKVTMGKDGIPRFLRPELNIERFNLSAERMCMPKVPAMNPPARRKIKESIDKRISCSTCVSDTSMVRKRRMSFK